MHTQRVLLTSRHAVRAVVVAGALVIGATVGRTSAASLRRRPSLAEPPLESSR